MFRSLTIKPALKFNRYILLVLMLVSFFFVNHPCFAQKEASTVVVAEGRATIVVDPMSARDRAIIDAKNRAIEKVGGVHIEARSIIDMGLTVDQFVQVKCFGFIERYEILDEGSKNGLYFVRIRAWVKTGKSQEDAYKELLSHRLLLIVYEGKGSTLINDELKCKLTNMGYSVLDTDFICGKLPAKAFEAIRYGRLNKVGVDAYKFLADYLIRVNSSVEFLQENSGIRSYYAKAVLDLIQVSSGRLVHSTCKMDVVFGLTEEQAINGLSVNAYGHKVARPASFEFIEGLTRVFSNKERNIRIIINNLPDRTQFQRFRNLVRELMWVKRISDEQYSNGVGILDVLYSERSMYLAGMIGFRSIYKINRYSWDEIEIEYQGEQ